MSGVHLSDNIRAYEAMREELECDHMGEWVIFYDTRLEGMYADFETAADEAVERFGQGPYLIRQVGLPPPALSASMLHRTIS